MLLISTSKSWIAYVAYLDVKIFDKKYFDPVTDWVYVGYDCSNMEVVIRSLHETLQYVIDSPKDIKTVLDVITALSTNNGCLGKLISFGSRPTYDSDSCHSSGKEEIFVNMKDYLIFLKCLVEEISRKLGEEFGPHSSPCFQPVLRTDLMEQVPQIAFLCHDNPEKLGGMVSGTLVPMVVNYLTDPSDLVRKTSQAALLVLLEQELVSHKDVEEQVCPVVLDLTESEAIDFFKIEAVAVISYLNISLGKLILIFKVIKTKKKKLVLGAVKVAVTRGFVYKSRITATFDELLERHQLRRRRRHPCQNNIKRGFGLDRLNITFNPFKNVSLNWKLMSKMAPLVGREMTEKYFLQRFTKLCYDSLFQVRKVCAANFGELSGVVGTDGTENVLLPYFLNLCEDGVWGVRKACADVFMVVSCACSLETRKSRLAPMFVSLLSDDSRWVRLASFQNLGPFISTFADPKVTGLHYNEEGILFIGSPPEGGGEQFNQSVDVDRIINCESKYERRDHSRHGYIINNDGMYSFEENQQSIRHCERYGDDEEEEDDDDDDDDDDYDDGERNFLSGETYSNNMFVESGNENLNFHFENNRFLNDNSEISDVEHNSKISKIDEHASDSVVTAKPDDDPVYNELNYWRIPLPEIELDFILEGLDIEEKPVIHDESICSPGNIIDNSEVQLPDTKDNSTFELTDFSKNEKDNDDENPAEEQKWEEKLENVENESKNIVSHEDDVQAELESLAASLAESIFCSDPKPESKNFEKIESELCGHLHNHVISAVSSQRRRKAKTKKVDQVSSQINRFTLLHCPAESQSSSSVEGVGKEIERSRENTVCSPEIHSLPPAEDTVKEMERSSDNSNYHDDDNSDEDSDVLSSNVGESDKRESTDQQESDTRLFNYSKSLRNRSFSNLSIVSDCGITFDNESGKLENFPCASADDLSLSERNKLSMRRRHRQSDCRKLDIRRMQQGQRKLVRKSNCVSQDIVPKTLLEHYISMTHPMRAEQVDDEITRHCAYSLPAVALTLGRRYWSVLRETYEKLAKDMHWKVRRTLAFSIHELALILGEELAQKDLLPVFEGLIKDLDEVRIGILKNLAHFLKMLPPPQRKLFLPRLSEFLTPDNVNNWRFRLELALQLAPISELFTSEECSKHICPITFDLMADKVVEIRRTCFVVVSQLAKQLLDEEGNSYIVPFSNKLIEDFAQADTWTKRQSFAYVVGQIIKDSSLPLPVVYSLLLPKFLELASDRVANIRLVVARIINTIILTRDCPDQEILDAIKETLFALQRDGDRDVQYFASMTSNNTEVMEGQDSNFY
ncbi:Serine/threonine-protein phosphatase 4 regulatory subunit 1 [Armadillidium nasatum]|uniref:Serine/threonine-protein phosphatase 4 regulatory subunit 1 n=1 Tax=Armadillidium nasatum TaxID=96803 RepID=A0A5N5TNH2_9CRUS|nr:Serine/threonine-protein phosphatase 4 regulatory subunit 1 [Armadillidium nasatum]